MRFELRRLADYSDQSILDEIRRVAAIVKEPKLAKSEFIKHSRVSPTTISRHFGSWTKALAAAELSDRIDSTNTFITEAEVVEELRRVAQLLATKVFNREQFNSVASCGDDVVRKRFGTWHKAMQAAGLDTNIRGKRYTDDECFENLLAVWMHFGRQPTHDEMKRAPSKVGPKAYTKRFGGWIKALQAFIDRVNADTDDSEQEIEPAPAVAERSTFEESDRREIRLGLRYSILMRDHFRCVLCGRSPATQLGIVLHVDHKVPVAGGGKTVYENLRTLCSDCNVGKGATHETHSP